MNAIEIIKGLWHTRDNHPVTAVTPNGTYEFDIVAVEGDNNHPVLRLVEIKRELPQ